MHSTETINQFLILRAQGWSFTRIADHLHVSKPTLIQWSRKHQPELDILKANQEHPATAATESPLPIGWGEGSVGKVGERSALQLEHLTLFHKTLRQEIIKRTLQTLSDDEIQTMADEIQHQIVQLRGQPSEALLAKDGKEISPASNGN